MPLSHPDTDRRSEARETVLVETERTVDSVEIGVWLGVCVCVCVHCVLKMGARKTGNWEMPVFKCKCGVINLYWI